jgi:hypothetical protein
VLRAPSSATHVIVVPTTRISGIESPALLTENAPNYWEAAWDARRFVEEGARRQLPRDKIGMAINSAASRSQDQLHIHVACIAPKVAESLRPVMASMLSCDPERSWFRIAKASLISSTRPSLTSALEAGGGSQRPDIDPITLSIEAKLRRAGKGKRLVIENGADRHGDFRAVQPDVDPIGRNGYPFDRPLFISL